MTTFIKLIKNIYIRHIGKTLVLIDQLYYQLYIYIYITIVDNNLTTKPRNNI